MPASARPSFEMPDQVLLREVDGEMVLLNLRSERYYNLDAVGANIVTRLTTLGAEESIAALSRDYDVPLDVLEGDVQRLVGELLQAGLITRVDTV